MALMFGNKMSFADFAAFLIRLDTCPCLLFSHSYPGVPQLVSDSHRCAPLMSTAMATMGPPRFNLEYCSGLHLVHLTLSSLEGRLPAFQRLHLSPSCPRVPMTTAQDPL